MSSQAATIVPAQLGFLTIYNPSFGTSDDALDDQIVYYASVNTHSQDGRRKLRRRAPDNVPQEERNERLRQIGLAQGMVEFGKGFSGDQHVDTIDTEKSRVILHELEPGWWILASVDLTQLPLSTTKSAIPSAVAPATSSETNAGSSVEYSSREVKPAALLLQDLLRAHAIFLLHHDSSLSAMFLRHKRTKFTSIIGRYWDLFLATWNVLLHGNPVRNVFGGIKIAACGELGMGVGEEDRGSGEREVLESLVGRVEGMVDLVVSKFGAVEGNGTSIHATNSDSKPHKESWLGSGNEPGAEDGVVFLGVGALSKHSLRDLSFWMEDLYTWGSNTYGVTDSPTSMRQPKKSRRQAVAPEVAKVSPEPFLQPPTPVTELAKRSKQSPPLDDSLKKPAILGPDRKPTPDHEHSTAHLPPNTLEAESGGSMDKYVNYLKLGYGKYWGPGSTAEDSPTLQDTEQPISSKEPRDNNSGGHFLIGLMGNVEQRNDNNDEIEENHEDSRLQDVEHREYNSRTMLRTVTVEMETDPPDESIRTQDFGSHDNDLTTTPLDHTVEDGLVSNSATGFFDSQDRNKTKKLRVVVYVNKPFMFTFLYRLRTDSLAWDKPYQSLHQQLGPLHRSLLNSTSYRPDRPEAGPTTASIFDLIWDPKSLTVHSTIPDIPEPNRILPPGEQPVWSRSEALNTHMQVLNMFTSTREDLSELERTCKTGRGWWVVWNRILEREISHRPRRQRRSNSDSTHDASDAEEGEDDDHDTTPTQNFIISKEIFLLRRASDHLRSSSVRTASASLVTAAGGSTGWADGASRLAQGIGVDTKKYIEGLLSLNR